MMNIALFGPPGVGKGTQSQRLIQRYQLVHIAPGELLRIKTHGKTAIGRQIASYIHKGKLVPCSLSVDLVLRQLDAHHHVGGFLFDGFPRTIVQAVALDQQLQNRHMRLDSVIFLEAPEEELIQRIQQRAKISGRLDDQKAAHIATRMRIYRDETLPVAHYYAQQKKLSKVNGVGAVTDIFARIMATLAPCPSSMSSNS